VSDIARVKGTKFLAVVAAGAVIAVATGVVARADDPAPEPSPTTDGSAVTSTNAPAAPIHPYTLIQVRNAFGIHPTPPPPDPVVEPPPVVEKLNVTITGVGVFGGKKTVYLAIQPKDAKNGPDYISVVEGETASDGYDLKVLEIHEDDDVPTVKVMNTGQEVVMNMKDNGFKGGPQIGGPPGAPGIFPGANLPPRVIPTMNQPGGIAAGGGGGPTIIGRGGQVYGGGDGGGGNALNPAANVSPNNVLLNGSGGAVPGAVPQIPTRVTRNNDPSIPGASGLSIPPANKRPSPIPAPPAPGE
jgi:hypothetical protein